MPRGHSCSFESMYLGIQQMLLTSKILANSSSGGGCSRLQ